MSTVALIAKLPVQPGKRDEFITAFSSMFPVVEDEEGTLVYAVHADDSDPDLVWVYELYTDAAALDVHSKSDGMASAIAAFGGLLAGAPELHRLTPVRAKGLDV